MGNKNSAPHESKTAQAGEKAGRGAMRHGVDHDTVRKTQEKVRKVLPNDKAAEFEAGADKGQAHGKGQRMKEQAKKAVGMDHDKTVTET